MRSWLVAVVTGAGLWAGLGCSSSNDAPSTPSEMTPECTGGNSCKCSGGTRSVTRCEADGSEVCDCACSDFTPLEPGPDFEACGGSLDGGWEISEVDLSRVPGTDFAHGCDTVQVTEAVAKFRLLFPGLITDTPSQAQVDRATEMVDLQLQRSCANPQASCEDLGASETECGTCEDELKRGGIVDKQASWHIKGSELFIAHPDFVQLKVPTDDYDYCVTGDSLELKDHGLGIVYKLTRKYFSGDSDACLPRSLKACEKLDGCHTGQCQGSAMCQLNDNQIDCEDDSTCTWHDELCGGVPSKRCAIDEYDVDPSCSVSDAAP